MMREKLYLYSENVYALKENLRFTEISSLLCIKYKLTTRALIILNRVLLFHSMSVNILKITIDLVTYS